jgi:hypothetical protein
MRLFPSAIGRAPNPGKAETKKKLTAEDAEYTEKKTLIQCFETSASSAVE